MPSSESVGARLLALAFALAVSTCAGAQQSVDARRSGSTYMSAGTQTLQRDDSQNPGMLWVSDGRELWDRVDGEAKKSCASCHNEITRMKGIAPRYPMYSSAAKRVVNLGQQINQCRVDQQLAPAWQPENASLLGLEAAIAIESRGLAVAPRAQPALAESQKRGEALFNRRIGQMDLSCRDCHDALAGKRLGGNVIPQGHPTGYPIYRLEWQSVGSVQRRLRGCMTAVRAEPYAHGASELVDLEAYLAKRAAGMKLESPGVRP